MSATTQFGISQDDALRVVHDQIYAPVFFAKLAEHGIVPQTAEEQVQLLALADKQATIKQAAAQNTGLGDLLSEVNGQLDVVLNQFGIPTAKVAADLDDEFQTVGAQFALQRPDLAKAVCAFAAFGG